MDDDTVFSSYGCELPPLAMLSMAFRYRPVRIGELIWAACRCISLVELSLQLSFPVPSSWPSASMLAASFGVTGTSVFVHLLVVVVVVVIAFI